MKLIVDSEGFPVLSYAIIMESIINFWAANLGCALPLYHLCLPDAGEDHGI